MSISDLREFPIVDAPDEVRCFHCSSRHMHDHQDAGFAPGRGQFKALCVHCHRWTFYDLTLLKGE